MIEHLRKYKNKELLYVMPVKPYPHIKIECYVICRVRVLKVRNTYCVCKIIDVISESRNWRYYSYCKAKNETISCSNIYLYDLVGVIYEKEIN